MRFNRRRTCIKTGRRCYTNKRASRKAARFAGESIAFYRCFHCKHLHSTEKKTR